jgi:hypothetical protein
MNLEIKQGGKGENGKREKFAANFILKLNL